MHSLYSSAQIKVQRKKLKDFIYNHILDILDIVFREEVWITAVTPNEDQREQLLEKYLYGSPGEHINAAWDC